MPTFNASCRAAAMLAVLTAAASCWPPAARAASPEIRGTWITTTSNDDWTSANIGTTMSSLKQAGLNTVYVQAWKNGYTNFTSGTLAGFTGGSSTNSGITSPTLLSDARSAAAASGLVMGAWFEYGNMAQFTGNTGTSTSSFNPLAAKCRDATWTVGTTSGTGWLLRDPNGNYTTGSNGFVWMNPLVPEVRNLIKGIAIDAVNQFDLQIVQFDDHLAWPQAYGWDSYTAAVYKQETNRNLPASTADANFASWRREKTQAFFAEVSDAVKAVKPSVIVSLAPSPITTSSSSFCFDWSQSMTKADEVLPQVYRSTISAFNTDWPGQITASGTNSDELGAGLRLLGTGASTPWNDLRQQIDRTRTDDALGHSIWYSNGISNSGTNAADNYNSQLTAYYDVATNGIAANPHFQSTRWSGTGGNGGSGTWSQLASQWKDTSTIWVSSGTGIFDGVGGTVTISGSVMAEAGLDFRTTGYTVTGGTLAFRGVFRADNTVTVASGATTTLASLLTGTTGLTKSGAGTLAITGSAAGLTGGVTVESGTLAVNGSLSNGGLFVSAAATLTGSGTVLGTTTIQGSHRPGNSPGIETFGTLVYSGSAANVTWELWDDVEVNSPLAFDQVIVNGDLTFSDSTQLILAFTGTGSQVNWTDPFWNADRQWLLYDVAGTTTGFGNLGLTAANWQDAAGNLFTTARPTASFSVFKPEASSDIYVSFTAVPEPSTVVLAAAAALAAGAVSVRRRRPQP
jgi:autotransporter-associated beta strand protein